MESITPNQHQKIIDELQKIITETIHLMDQFEENETLTPLNKDYANLQNILAKAIKQQRTHIRAQITSEKLKLTTPVYLANLTNL